MMDHLASVLRARPRLVLLGWIVVLAFSAPLAARVSSVSTTDSGRAPGGPADDVERTIASDFASHDRAELVLVGQSPEDAFYDIVERLSDVPGVVAVRDARTDPVLDLEGDAAPSLAVAEIVPSDERPTEAIVDDVRAVVAAREDLPIYVTGGPVVDLDLKRTSEADAFRAELIGLPLSLIVLVIVFGSWVAAALPLIAAVVSITVSFALLYVLGQAVPIAAFAQIIVTMLGLAIGIDYALLLVNRYREELRQGRTPDDALHVTLRTAGASVLFSGSTVLLALSALLVPPLDFVRTMGAAAMIVLAVGMAVAVTAVPAMLSLLGDNVNALRVTRRAPGTRSRAFWRAWTERVLARPRLWLVIGSLPLVLLSAAALDMRFGFSGVQGITRATDTARAQRLLEDAGLAGLLQPYEVLVDYGERGFYHPSSVRSMSEYVRAAGELDAVERVLAPTTTGSLPRLFMAQYYATQETAEASPLADLARATVSLDGRRALVRVYPAGAGQAASPTLARDLAEAADELGLDVVVGGALVAEREWAETLYGDFPLVVGLVFLATFLLLSLAFRSIAIPIKSLLLNTLTVGSAFGAITLVIQHGWFGRLFGLTGGIGFVETSVPVFIFAIVFGLSMDYEVFLIARLVESHERGATDRQAVLSALTSTGGVITSAAAIMIVVFSVFLLSDVVLIKTLSLGLTIAVLVDATLVRSILVPAAIVLMGDLNWRLPAWLGRWIDRVGLRHG